MNVVGECFARTAHSVALTHVQPCSLYRRLARQTGLQSLDAMA